MIQAYQRPRLKKSASMRLHTLFFALFPLFILILIPFVLLYLVENKSSSLIRGWVETESENVGPAADARLVRIHVQPGQSVEAGSPLLTFSLFESPLQRRLDNARLASYRRDEAGYSLRLDTYRQNLLEKQRRAGQLLKEASADLEEQRMNQARERAELKGLESEIKRIAPLVQERLISETELSSLRPKAEALAQMVNRYAPLIKTLEERVALAEKDLETISRTLLEFVNRSPLEGSGELFSLPSGGTEEIFTLKAVKAGTVSHLFHQCGDIVTGGEPVLRLCTEPHPEFISAWLPPSDLQRLHPGEILEVLRPSAPVSPKEIRAEVTALSPEIADLFDPSNPAPRYPVRGRKIRLRILDKQEDLLPGEPLLLRPLSSPSFKGTMETLFTLWKKPI